MSSRNTPDFLADTLQELHSAAIDTWLFGGWAEELWGLRSPGPHSDIDLLYPAEDFRAVDQFLLAHEELEEVVGKRLVHKRAFRRQGILVELFLLRHASIELVTDFFSLHSFQWPADTLLHTVPLLGVPVPVASPAALHLYRDQHKAVEETYQQYLAEKEESTQ